MIKVIVYIYLEKRNNLWVSAGFTKELRLVCSTLPSSSVTSILQSLFSTLLSKKIFVVKIPSTITSGVHSTFGKIYVERYLPSLVNKNFLSTARRMLDKLYAAWEGNRVFFSREEILLSGASDFAKNVLLLTMKIPKGFVTTYGDLAQLLGGKRYSRAVANVLSENPLPLAIPCHRVIYFDGRLGGYSAEGGIRIKKQLLEREGVRFTLNGKVRKEYIVKLSELIS